MRALSPQALALLNGGNCKLVDFVEMQTDVPLRMNSSPVDIDWSGNTWIGAGSLGTVEVIKDSAGGLDGLRFQLSGLPVEALSLALSEEARGKVVYVYLCILDSTTEAIVWVELVWSGYINKMPISHSPPRDGAPGSITIGVEANHAGIQMQRSRPLRFSEEDTQKISPGDTSGRFALLQATEPLAWPTASYFKQ